jgi:hypothetical protein
MKYEYTVEEYSQDTRTYTIKTNEPLDYEWLKENWHSYCDSSLEQTVVKHEDVEISDKTGAKTTLEVFHEGTDYGEDCQQDISCTKGDFAKEEEADIRYMRNED